MSSTYNYKTPSQVQADYLTVLKSIQPSVNTDQTDSDWWIRGAVVGGVISGAYADQQKVEGDIFPQTARTQALTRFLVTYGLVPPFQIQPTNADGNVAVTGTNGTVYTIGTQFQHLPTGNVYQAVSGVTLSGTTGSVPVLSVGTGASQNLLPGTTLTLSSPPAGSNSLAAVINMQDGRDLETNEEMATRILARIQNPISGGTQSDYQQWALAGDPSVVTSNVVRFVYGPGTVGVYITSGTTDIDAAIDAGLPIIRIPSANVIASVQSYINGVNPLTDCATVFAVQELPVNVTVNVSYVPGITDATIIPSVGLTALALVQREISRVLYKIPPGGRQIGGVGYVLASEIEEGLDFGLSAQPYTTGVYAQILLDRQVQALASSGVNLMISNNQIVSPGVLTIVG